VTSDPDLERLLAGFEAFNGRDVEAFAALASPDIEIVPLRAALEDTRYLGQEGIRQFIDESGAMWSSIRAVVEDVRRVGDRYPVLGRLQGRGADSGATVDAEVAWVCDVRDGKITRVVTHTDRDAARAELDPEG
jgi:ketosteroid isomerase-like protein